MLNCWVELRCNSSVWQQSCPYKIQSATQRGQAVARCRAGAGHTDITHYYHPQDWNCFAADKLTQADHSIQYSIDQNFKSKMGSWGWQDEGWNTSKALYYKVNKNKNMYGLVYGSVSKLKRTGLGTCMIIIELWTIQQQPEYFFAHSVRECAQSTVHIIMTRRKLVSKWSMFLSCAINVHRTLKDSDSLVWFVFKLCFPICRHFTDTDSNVCLFQVTVTMAEWTATFPAVCRSPRCPAWPRSPSVSRDFVITQRYPWAHTTLSILSIRDSFTCYYFEYTSTAAYLDCVRRF